MGSKWIGIKLKWTKSALQSLLKALNHFYRFFFCLCIGLIKKFLWISFLLSLNSDVERKNSQQTIVQRALALTTNKKII